MDGTLMWAQELAHPYSLAAVVAWSAWFHLFRRESALAQAQVGKAIVLCQQHGYRFYLARCIVIEGWVLAQQGQIAVGMARMQEGLAALLTMDAYIDHPVFLALLAEVYGQAGQPEQGLRLLDEALDNVATTGQRHYEAEMHRLKGELLRMEGADAQNVESQFLQALTIARQQEAKSLELRAAMSLARLWRQQDKRRAAYDLLAEVYGWFTEGFDTPDLQDAQALLAALA
jgi:predicted ATPase